VIDRAIEAKGGLETLRTVKTIRAVSETTLSTPQGPVTTTTTTSVEYPDRFRVEARLPIGTAVQVYAGNDNVWVTDPIKGLVEPPPNVRREFRDSVQRDVLALLLRAQAGELRVRAADRPAGDETPGVDAVELSGAGMTPVVIEVDRATGMVTKERYTVGGLMGGLTEEVFADYRKVNGIMIAFRASLRRGSLPVVERVVKQFSINVPLDPSLFAKPAR